MVRHVFPNAFHEVYSEYGTESDSHSMETSICSCTKCGRSMLPAMQFCGVCGARASAVPVPLRSSVCTNVSELPGVPERSSEYSGGLIGDTGGAGENGQECPLQAKDVKFETVGQRHPSDDVPNGTDVAGKVA